MCFSYSLFKNAKEIEDKYKDFLIHNPNLTGFEPFYFREAFRKPFLPIITNIQPYSLNYSRWGLIPFWAKDFENAQSISSLTFNAKIETIYDKPSFKYSAHYNRRCLVPTTGFFEWHNENGKKEPYFIKIKNCDIFCLAGLYDIWVNKENDEKILSFTIITIEANELMKKIHNTKQRMPYIIQPGEEKMWLEDKNPLKFFQIESNMLEAYKVSNRLRDNTKISITPVLE